MASPASPKKQWLMPASRLRKALRAAGHHLSPVVQVGREGVSAAVLLQLDGALRAHELVKVKVGSESPEDRFETAARVAAGPGMQLAQLLGRTLLVYRRHPTRPRFEPAPEAATLVAGRGGKVPVPKGPGRPPAAREAPGARTPRAPRR